MLNADFKYIYGPVPSRRLGRSLGIDLVPYKTCTYDCIYCQLGRTDHKTIERREYLPADDIKEEIKAFLDITSHNDFDYITISGSGEPTLHSEIGSIIETVRTLTNTPVAVITNSSLLYKKNVREALLNADLVMPSLDAGNRQIFAYINRPHKEIHYISMLESLIDFSKEYKHKLWLEIFLLDGINAFPEDLRMMAQMVSLIKPDHVHLNTVTRPPCEDYAGPVPLEKLHRFRRLFDCNTSIPESADNLKSISLSDSKVTDRSIISMLARRPCTIEDLAHGLGISINHAVKMIGPLVKSGRVSARRIQNMVYYERNAVS